MKPTDAINLLNQLVEQTRLLPSEYRQLREALETLSEIASSKDKK